MTSLKKLWEKYNFENEEVEVITEGEVHRDFKKYMDYGLYDREELEPDMEDEESDIDIDDIMEELMEEEIDESSGAGAGAVVGAPGLGGEWVDEDEYRKRIKDTKNRMHIKGK